MKNSNSITVQGTADSLWLHINVDLTDSELFTLLCTCERCCVVSRTSSRLGDDEMSDTDPRHSAFYRRHSNVNLRVRAPKPLSLMLKQKQLTVQCIFRSLICTITYAYIITWANKLRLSWAPQWEMHSKRQNFIFEPPVWVWQYWLKLPYALSWKIVCMCFWVIVTFLGQHGKSYAAGGEIKGKFRLQRVLEANNVVPKFFFHYSLCQHMIEDTTSIIV